MRNPVWDFVASHHPSPQVQGGTDAPEGVGGVAVMYWWWMFIVAWVLFGLLLRLRRCGCWDLTGMRTCTRLHFRSCYVRCGDVHDYSGEQWVMRYHIVWDEHVWTNDEWLYGYEVPDPEAVFGCAHAMGRKVLGDRRAHRLTLEGEGTTLKTQYLMMMIMMIDRDRDRLFLR